MKKRTVALLLFDDVEVLDFAGPFEVFSVANELNENAFLDISTVGRTREVVTARNGLLVQPDCPMTDLANPDIVIIPGGAGTRAVIRDEMTMAWIAEAARTAERVLSVCTGALVLGSLGLLAGLPATTHHENLDVLARMAPDIRVVSGQRFVDTGQIVTSGGISAGIDMSLSVVEALFGSEVRTRTETYMEWEN